MRKILKIVGFSVLLLFLVTSLELHADDDLGAAAEAHCSVTCCPSHHLGPQATGQLTLAKPLSDRYFAPENRDDPSTTVPLSVFHPPKTATL